MLRGTLFALQLLDRCESISATPLTVCNLCKPTLPAYPPAEDRYHWRVMSHLGTRFPT